MRETADSVPRLLVFGASGQLGQELIRQDALGSARVTALPRAAADVTRAGAVEAAVCAALEAAPVDAVVNATAYTAVDRAEADQATAFAVNRDGPANLAAACLRHDLPLIHVSTDYVFDGSKRIAWREADAPRPLGAYGRSKLAGETAIRELLPRHVILRTAWVYSSFGQNFVKTMLRLGAERSELKVVHDQRGCPTAAEDLAAAVVTVAGRLGRAGAEGLGTFHYCGRGEATWFEFALRIFVEAARYGRPAPRVVPISTAEYPTPAVRPANSVLDCSRIEAIYRASRPAWQESLGRVIAELCSNHRT